MLNAFEYFDLKGKTALVTGGGSGIGYHMTRALLRSGAKVMIADRRVEVMKQGAEKLMAEGPTGEVMTYPVELGDRKSIRALADHAIKTLGGVDIFIGNAGLGFLEPLGEIKDESIDQILQINVSANVELFRAFLPHMRKNQWGRALFSSSTASICGSATDGCSMYATTKGALNGFVSTAAAEVGHDGITVNALVFATFYTELLQGVITLIETRDGKAAADAFLETSTSMTALGRLAEGKDVEGTIQLLASNAGSYITGTCYVLDGGLTSMLRPYATNK